MASLNKVMLIGNLGKDPEIRQTTKGLCVATFPLATSDKYKNKSGEWEEKTEWHRVTFWAKMAEVARDYLSKGKTVYVEGRLQTRKWQDNSGNDRYTTEIVGEKMQLLSAKDSADYYSSNTEVEIGRSTDNAQNPSHQYDQDGYDKDGYDKDGYDRNEYDRDGRPKYPF